METFDTGTVARSHYDSRANIDKQVGILQKIAGLGDDAYVTIYKDTDTITMLKGARILRISLLGKLKHVEPKGPLIKFGTAALHRL